MYDLYELPPVRFVSIGREPMTHGRLYAYVSEDRPWVSQSVPELVKAYNSQGRSRLQASSYYRVLRGVVRQHNTGQCRVVTIDELNELASKGCFVVTKAPDIWRIDVKEDAAE